MKIFTNVFPEVSSRASFWADFFPASGSMETSGSVGRSQWTIWIIIVKIDGKIYLNIFLGH